GPFAWVYLYDTINHREQMVTTREQLAQVIKHVWEYINFGPVADRYRSLLEHMHTEFPKVFSAAGMAGLEYPVKRIQKQGAYQTGLYVIRDLVSPHPEAKAVGQELLADFLRQQPEFETLPPLRQGVNGKPVLPGYAQFEQTVMNLPRQQFLSGMDSVMDRVLTDTQAGLDGKIEAEIQRLSQLLAQQGISIANKPHGLSLAATFLTAFDALMTQHQTALKLRIERGQAEGNRLRQNIKTLEEKWLPKLTLKVRRQHQQARYDLLVHRVNSKITHGQYQVVSRLREQVRDDLKALAGMAGALRDLHDRVQSAEADYIRRQQNRISVVFESLLDETEIDQVVANRLAERGSQARDGLRFEWAGDGRLTLLYRDSQESGLDHWQLVSPEGVEQHMAYCHTFWQYLAGECSVEGYLHQHGIDRAQLIAHLEQQAAPWVTINQARQVPAEHRLLVLGTETGPAFISEAPSHINVVATGDKTRLVLLSTVHGFDVMNLQQTPAWQDAYEQQLAAGKSVHVMPEVDPLAQPQETKSESNREINQEKEMTYVAA
ncbi:MAG: hypothetical protein KDE34_25220, partial [Anaerolineales bacterium]|nr:hypothetical protein [Anaerolineales bacterium]